MRLKLYGTLIAVCALGWSSAAHADLIYSNDFSGPVGPELSHTATDVTPIGARRFLGQFGNDAVTLSLTGLPAHSHLLVELDLFIIRTWGGNGTEPNSIGPDVWWMEVVGGPVLLNTTFSTAVFRQAYPDAFPGGDHPANTGASEVDTLGFAHPVLGTPEDAVYRLSFLIPHAASSISLRFTGIGLEPIDNESWGLDNVRITAVPEPSSLFSAAFGLFTLAGYGIAHGRRSKRA